MKKTKPYKFTIFAIILLSFIYSLLFSGCGSSNSSDSTPSIASNVTLSRSIGNAIEDALTAETNKRNKPDKDYKKNLYAANASTITSIQINSILTTGLNAIDKAGLTDSTSLNSVMPVIIRGTQGALNEITFSDTQEKIKVIKTIVETVVDQISPNIQYLDNYTPEIQLINGKESNLSILYLMQA